MEALLCKWLYLCFVLIFFWASLTSAHPLVNRAATTLLARMMVALMSCLTAAFEISVDNLSWLVAPVSLQSKANDITSVTYF